MIFLFQKSNDPATKNESTNEKSNKEELTNSSENKPNELESNSESKPVVSKPVETKPIEPKPVEQQNNKSEKLEQEGEKIAKTTVKTEEEKHVEPNIQTIEIKDNVDGNDQKSQSAPTVVEEIVQKTEAVSEMQPNEDKSEDVVVNGFDDNKSAFTGE